MPAPAHYRLTFSGIFGPVGNAYDEWSFGVSLSDVESPFLVRSDLPAIASSMAAHWGALAPSINAVARLQNVRLAFIGADGKYARETTGAMVFADVSTNQPGSAPDALTKPLQVSLAVSLETAIDAPYGRGRFYLPAPEVGALEADGRMVDSVRDVIQNRALTFLSNVRDTWKTAGGTGLVIASSGSALRGIQPALRPVTGVRVGRRLDIQRRRAGDLSEAFDPASAIAP